MSKKIKLVLPHQLFELNPLFDVEGSFLMIEEFLFFRQYNFHKQKIAFHRASMRWYASWLEEKGAEVIYISSFHNNSDLRKLDSYFAENSFEEVHMVDPVDNWITKRIKNLKNVRLYLYECPGFLNRNIDNKKFFKGDKKFFFQTSFYKEQRQRYNVLLQPNGEPEGGKWSFDDENRKKYPKGKNPPPAFRPQESVHWNEAVNYAEQFFPNNPGSVDTQIYPIDFESSKAAFNHFLDYRFYEFGDYEDAIVQNELTLHHSLLTPALNSGLLTPHFVLDKTIKFAKNEKIPLNSTEGFVRQVIGWREFIRGMYECKGTEMRTSNFWNFNRKIPQSFYNGTTGIIPIDETIQKILKTGYCHHIERLMILGNFMLICEFDPNEVYRWFMELFIDSYDWVMVPNVYGMSQFADGGYFATKPYISGSNYIKKMSNYPGGEWERIWDALFWNFIDNHQEFFTKNPRLSMMVHTFNKMNPEKKSNHLLTAYSFLVSLDSIK